MILKLGEREGSIHPTVSLFLPFLLDLISLCTPSPPPPPPSRPPPRPPSPSLPIFLVSGGWAGDRGKNRSSTLIYSLRPDHELQPEQGYNFSCPAVFSYKDCQSTIYFIAPLTDNKHPWTYSEPFCFRCISQCVWFSLLAVSRLYIGLY